MEEASEFPALITVGKSVLNDQGEHQCPAIAHYCGPVPVR